ncbi:tRNA (N6-threonylcarbamoyladenosine(37)-N6)-methyltransferase TrmO [Methanoculleus sp.]|jgi:tRNA-Thr(GGU) m(6)t(6)A37 methyltransferase TsaA|uniref:tRNA (N6-threonylcarbamoyladenosine(37)-N6)-methyltransferase TrmO n=1 Tax=Methanoculleus sp. TaxID=90427 RepID=UPI001BD2577F|nr:tRNA (N6-threonylcarbamoyladenosine(37)-N6)-methyltransferase TrmO [Methanoculleus sp.]
MNVDLNPIGYVSSPYKRKRDAPRQGRLTDTETEIVIDERYLPGLFRVEEKKHLFVLCWFDRSDRTALRATPPHNPVEHGVFATRSPNRPNPISLSLVDVIDITGGRIRVRGLEALDGTPVLDIKPYSEEIDCPK